MGEDPKTKSQGSLLPFFAEPDSATLEEQARHARNAGDRKLARLLDARIRLEESSSAARLGFTSRSMIQCTLPHADPGKHIVQFRREDPHSGVALELLGSPTVGLPYGAISRLFLTYLMTQVVQTKEHVVFLGRNWSAVGRSLGISDDANSLKRLRNHVLRCFYTTFALEQPVPGDDRKDPDRNIRVRRFQVLEAADLPRVTDAEKLAITPVVKVDETFYRELTGQPVVPFQFEALKRLSGSALAIDLYLLLNFKRYRLDGQLALTYEELMTRFGSQYPNTVDGRKGFKRHLKRQLANICAIWPDLKIDAVPGGVILYPGPSHVTPKLPK